MKLSRNAICQAAIELIQMHGLEVLSMRRLADSLGVKAASLYNHIEHKSQLLDLIQEYLYTQMPAAAIDTNSWQQHLKDLADHTRRGLLQYPNLVPLFATRPTINAASLQQMEQTFGILSRAGFHESEIIYIVTNLHVFILGHLLAEVGKPPGASDACEPSLGAVDMSSYPNILHASSSMGGQCFDKEFALGINTFISGLEQLQKQGGSSISN